MERASVSVGGKHGHHPSRVGREDMTLKRMDNVLIVVEDLEAAKAFFVELGMELEGEMPVEGRWVDRIVGLENVRCEISMMRTPDGHGRIELDKFHAPAAVRTEPRNAPVNTVGRTSEDRCPTPQTSPICTDALPASSTRSSRARGPLISPSSRPRSNWRSISEL